MPTRNPQSRDHSNPIYQSIATFYINLNSLHDTVTLLVHFWYLHIITIYNEAFIQDHRCQVSHH